MKTPGNKRKNKRFHIPLEMEFVLLKREAEYFLGKTRDFSCDGLSFASNSIDGETEGLVMIKFKLPQDYKHIYALGDIRWKRQVADKYLVGVKIRRIDLESRSRKLDFPFNIWVDNIT